MPKTKHQRNDRVFDPIRTMTRHITQAPLFLAGAILALAGSALCADPNPSNGNGQRLDWRAGGGFLHAGIVGEYFANAELSGQPEFTRRELRIDFDWGDVLTPGGSLSPAYQRVGHDKFSVRWLGKLAPRFSEDYSFIVDADDGVRMFIREEKAETWQPLISAWDKAGENRANHSMIADRTYELRLEYQQKGGPARIRLWWEGPSFRRELIQAATNLGVMDPPRAALMANGYRSSWYVVESYSGEHPRKDGKLERCASDWPAEDFTFIPHFNFPGTYHLRFNGRADVSANVPGDFFSVDKSAKYGRTLNASSSTAGYDAARNVTEALFVQPDDSKVGPSFTFRNTDRDGKFDAGGKPDGDGVTELWAQKPICPGANTAHEVGEWFSRPVKSLWERFTFTRWHDVNGAKLEDPDDHVECPCLAPWGVGDRHGIKHAMKVMFANETGSDLWVEVPHHVVGGETIGKNDEYVRKLAQLLRYGCDADGQPYDHFQANPAFPGLNPNLRVYVEFSNEVPWNSAGQYPQSPWLQQRAAWEVENKTETGKIINFDAQATNPLDQASRYIAIRVRRISDIFREVWGDDNMPFTSSDPHVRPVLMGQYGSPRIALHQLYFFDSYFNNASGEHVPNPRPVQYYLWLYGAAIYYAGDNPYGLLHDFDWANANAENPVLRPGELVVAPGNAPGWSFTGMAGIYRNAARTKIAVPETLKVEDKDIALYDFYGAKRDKVSVYDVADNTLVMRRDLIDGHRKAGGLFFFTLEEKRFPLILKAGHAYRFEKAKETTVAKEPIGGGSADKQVNLGFAYDAAEGEQGIFLAGKSSATIDLALPGEDVYAVRYQLAHIRDPQRAKEGGGWLFSEVLPNPLDTFLVRPNGEEERISFAGRDNTKPGTGPSAHGDFGRKTDSFQIWGTAPFKAAGKVRIRFVGTHADSRHVVFIDDVRLASVGAFARSTIPASGSATGEIASAQWYEAKRKQFHGQAYGLRAGSYEGGWYPGGDWDRTPLQLYLPMHGEAMRGIEYKVQRFYDSLGLQVQCDSSLGLAVPHDDYHRSTDYQRPLAWDDAQSTLPAEASSGLPPGDLPVEKALWAVYADAKTAVIKQRGGIFTWNIIVPEIGDYSFKVNLKQAADFALFIDGAEIVANASNAAAADGVVKKLTKGLHAVRLQSRGERPVEVSSLNWGKSGASK